MKKLIITGLTMCCVAGFISGWHGQRPVGADEKKPVKWAPAVQPKALVGSAKLGLAWLAEHQNKDGGWGQGEEANNMRGSQGHDNVAYQSNVADTCVACLAMLRSGSSPAKGEYSRNLQDGIAYVCSQVEQSDNDSLAVTNVKGTRVQSKLGPYIDTFMASLMLAEAKGQMADDKSEKRLLLALNKVIHKIEKNQKADGTYSNEGWAPVLAQSMATKGLNRAAQNGADVSQSTLTRSEDYARASYDAPSGGFSKAGNAGVELYSASAGLTNMQDSINTNAAREQELKDRVREAKTEAERDEAKKTLEGFEKTKEAQGQARKAVVGRLDDKQFLAGFGSNGGEEFLSYMNISESLVATGGKEWEKWDTSMTENLSRIQNPDGSWSGHHCITGRTFCTATAILVLTADRAPVPLAIRK